MAHIFCDLDGVLVDFEGGFLRNYGFAHNSVPEGSMWRAITKNPRHWHDLPALADHMELWEYIRGFNPTILTGCPSSGRRQAAEGKRHWVASLLGADYEVITCPSKDKQLHMRAPGDILIDDLSKNCKRWTDAGGIAVHHTSAADSILQLKALGF
jgi:hypothetical protein